MQTRVAMEEFRENLQAYIESQEPVEITRNGETVGVYTPTLPKVRWRETIDELPDPQTLDEAHERVQAEIAAAGTSEEELLADLERLHQERKRRWREEHRS